MQLGVVLAETLSGVEDLLAIRAAPCESLLVKLLFVGLPVGLGLERLVAEGAGKVLGGGGRGGGDGRKARGGGRQARRGAAIVGKRRVGGCDG